jgi:multidrug efflux pump subunit AcrA (membrane-fusion protein)
VGLAAYLTREQWLAPHIHEDHTEEAEEGHQDHDNPNGVKLSAQARANLRLVVRPVEVQDHWRSVQLPGVIVERHGQTDRAITAPAGGVITRIQAFPGSTVKPGEALFVLRLSSEYVQNTQTELFKASQEITLTREKKKRLADAARTGAVAESMIIELDNQERRQTALVKAFRQDLLIRGLTAEQVNRVMEGDYVKEVTVGAVPPAPEPKHLVSSQEATANGAPPEPTQDFEVQELKVQLGEQVQAGQLLAVLSNHSLLYIEGRGFKKEARLLEQAAEREWPVEAEFPEEEASSWPSQGQPLHIRHLANAVDPVSRTFAFYVPLANQFRTYEKDGRTFLLWRFRPGQRVRLKIPVEELKGVIVLPAGAVVREGPEAYVFRQNGDVFDRVPARVLYEDRSQVVLANEGSVAPGMYVATNGAASLNRVLKAQRSEGGQAPDHGHAH